MHRRILVCLILVTTGCATMRNGPQQNVSVRTDPAGANVEVSCGNATSTHVTPAVVRLPRRADECRLTITRDGFESETVQFENVVSRSFWWNLAPAAIALPAAGESGHDGAFLYLLGGTALTGAAFGTDAITGAMWTQVPRDVSITLKRR
jgi:hypothetical protein